MESEREREMERERERERVADGGSAQLPHPQFCEVTRAKVET